jgi:hypothetical protein
MNMEEISKRASGTATIFWKKHGAAVLTTAGIAGFGATTILVGRAVLKSQEKVKLFKVRHAEISGEEIGAKFTQKQKAEAIGELWVKEGFDILKDFAPAIFVGSASAACIIASHGMMRNQKAALAAAYTALDASYRAYRKRVQEEIGEEKERELYRKVRMVERQKGEDPELPCEVDWDDTLPSPYAKVFDESNRDWTKTPEYNYFFLRTQQKYLNNRLNSYGYVFLNEVYESLGFDRTQAGQVVGWLSGERGGKDGYIDFGLYDIDDDSNRAFLNGTETTILLDFNVDGPIIIP